MKSMTHGMTHGITPITRAVVRMAPMAPMASMAALAALALLVACPAMAQNWGADYRPGALTYTSSVRVMKLSGDVRTVLPRVSDARIPGGSAALYLSSLSALGHYGPLSAYGPLGTLGPIGRDVWNPSYWISAVGDWGEWSEDTFGPLGPDGPLGAGGPVAPAQYYGEADPGRALFASNDFAAQTRAMGLWSVLGPIGPLGALGPLGPLGPVGAHGLRVERSGDYTRDGAVVREIEVDFDGRGDLRRWPLFEDYTDEAATQRRADNDTSFMVRGALASRKEADVYTIHSAHDQIVTILVVPEKELDDFDLAVATDDGRVRIVANTGYETMDWIQMEVPAGTALRVAVGMYWSGHFLSSTYRLIVVGSGPLLNRSNITGEHVGVWR